MEEPETRWGTGASWARLSGAEDGVAGKPRRRHGHPWWTRPHDEAGSALDGLAGAHCDFGLHPPGQSSALGYRRRLAITGASRPAPVIFFDLGGEPLGLRCVAGRRGWLLDGGFDGFEGVVQVVVDVLVGGVGGVEADGES